MWKSPKFGFWILSSTSCVTCVACHTKLFGQGSGVAKSLDVDHPDWRCNFWWPNPRSRTFGPIRGQGLLGQSELRDFRWRCTNPRPKTFGPMRAQGLFAGDLSGESLCHLLANCVYPHALGSTPLLRQMVSPAPDLTCCGKGEVHMT